MRAALDATMNKWSSVLGACPAPWRGRQRHLLAFGHFGSAKGTAILQPSPPGLGHVSPRNSRAESPRFMEFHRESPQNPRIADLRPAFVWHLFPSPSGWAVGFWPFGPAPRPNSRCVSSSARWAGLWNLAPLVPKCPNSSPCYVHGRCMNRCQEVQIRQDLRNPFAST